MKSNTESTPSTKTDPIEAGGVAKPSSNPVKGPASSPGSERFQQAVSRSGRTDDPEEDLWRGGYSAKDMVGLWLVAGFVSVAVLGVALWAEFAFGPPWMTALFWIGVVVALALLWIGLALRLLLLRISVDYRLTSQRLVHKEGILRRVSDRVETIDMDDIAFQQSLLQRMMGVGDITILSSDQSHPKLVMRGIDNVTEVAAKLDTARRKERVRRGVHVEQI